MAGQIRDAFGGADAVGAVAFRACRIRELLAVPDVVAVGVERTELVGGRRLRRSVRAPQGDPGAYGHDREQASGFAVDRHSLNSRLSGATDGERASPAKITRPAPAVGARVLVSRNAQWLYRVASKRRRPYLRMTGPRISPAGNNFECKLKYHRPSFRSLAWSLSILATPWNGLARLPGVAT